jgi:hypothetical protein
VTYVFHHFTYAVDFAQHGSCLSGWLNDPYFSVIEPILGTVNGNFVTFSFTYPSRVEGTRTYIGSINHCGVRLRALVPDGNRVAQLRGLISPTRRRERARQDLVDAVLPVP